MINVGRHKAAKTRGKIGKAATSHGVSITQMATDASSYKTVAALVGGCAVGGTGIGLLIGAGVLTLTAGGMAGRSAYKTNQHINYLKQIQRSARAMDCSSKNPQHDFVVQQVLPYIISKKQAKLHRKALVAGSLGVGSALETARAATKKAYKYCIKGDLGKARDLHARALAYHFTECDCELSNEIVAELYSDEIMQHMKGLPFLAVAELIKDKMKSV